MSHPYCKPFFLLISWALAVAISPVSSLGATPTPAAPPQQAATAPTDPADAKADAYYHFSMGHLYEELAGAYGNRTDYLNKAIDNYRLAMKEDPNAGFLVKDIAELYRLSGRIREAVEEAQLALKANPDDLNAHRVLARIYTQQIGDAQANRIDEGMAKRAMEQYQFLATKDPKDADSLVMLGRLQKLLGNSTDAEDSFKKALAAEPDNEEAVTGLSGVYSDRGDPKSGADLLERLNKKSPSPRTLITLANEYEQMRQYAQAADAYRRALELDPSRAELQGAMAQDLTLAGRFDDALKAYQSWADANSQSSEPYIGMALIYRQQKKWSDAQGALDKAKAIEPDGVEINYNQALLLQDEGKLPEAIAVLKSIADGTGKQAAASNSEKSARAEVLERLGTLYSMNQQYDKAVETFRQITAVNPDLGSRVEAQIIETYRAAKNFPKAQQEIASALAQYPKDRTLIEVHSQVLGDQGKTDEAVAELRKLLDGRNDREVYIAMAERYQVAKNWSEMAKAIDAADKLSTTKDDKTTIAFMRGEMYERQKQFDLAEKEFRSVLANDPDNASALNYLGYMLADRGVRLPEAQEFIKHAVKLDPNNYAFLDSLGWVYYRQNKLDDAEEQLRHSLQISSDDPTIHDHLGDVYIKQGKFKEAIDQWQASLKAYNTTAPSETEPEEVAKVQKKLDSARVRLAEGKSPRGSNQ